jgi:hypothetical protein
MLIGVTQIVYRTALAPIHSDPWAHSTACPLAIPFRPNRREHETRNCVSCPNY